MEGIYQTISNAFQTAIGENVRTIIEKIPNIISAILIFLIGWIVAKIAEKIVAKVAKSLGVDDVAEKRGVSKMLQDYGLEKPASTTIGRFVYWIVLIFFLIPTLNSLQLAAVSAIVAMVLLYVPKIVAALLIFIVGATVARFLGASVAGSAKSAGLEYAPQAGLFIKYFLLLIVLILGLSQLGIETEILTIIFAVIVGTSGLAIALALGLGSRAVISNILAGAFAREHFPEGKDVEIQGVRGKIIVVGSVTTRVQTDNQEMTVPNTVLIENVIE